MRRLGLFGGSFDPVHVGHTTPAAHALSALALDAVVFAPAARPPHKSRPLTPFAHRFAMLALATAGDDRFLVSDVELEGAGPGFTVDLIARFAAREPGAELFFLLGSDSFLELPTWHRWRDLVDATHLVVLHRPGSWGESMLAAVPVELRRRTARVDEARAATGAPRIWLLEHEPVDASATELRDRLGRGAATPELSHAVARYARKHRLYDQGEGPRHGL